MKIILTQRLSLCIIAILVVAITVLFCQPLMAEDNIFGMDRSLNVDIYLEGYDELTVIRNVEIVEFREVRDRVFVVISTDHFDSQHSEGLILFDAIRVILPSYKGNLMPGTKRVVF